MITTDLDGTVLLINNVAEDADRLDAGGGRRAAARRRVPELRSRDPGALRELRCDSWRRAPGTPGVTRSTVLVARDLTERPIEEIAAPLRDAAGRTIGMVVAFRDITDALKMQEERAQAEQARSLGLLAGGIAHDFNNILMAIMGNVSMARVAMPAGRPRGAALAEARTGLPPRAAADLAAPDVLARAACRSRSTIALPRILEESAGLALRGSNVTLHLRYRRRNSVAGARPTTAQLVQVFTNVLINAQQAMPHGGVDRSSRREHLRADRAGEYALRVEPGRYVRMSITDTGIGIPEENLGSIFDPYFSTKQRGSGLGLATSHSIVKNHGGFVSGRVEARARHDAARAPCRHRRRAHARAAGAGAVRTRAGAAACS